MAKTKDPDSTRRSRATADILAETGVVKRAFTVPEFCARHTISLGTYTRMKQARRGPCETRIGRRVTITDIAEDAWMKAVAAEGRIELAKTTVAAEGRLELAKTEAA